MKNKENIKVCLVGSSGGHLTHLYMLKPFWKNKDHFWVSATRSQTVKSLRTSNGFPLFGELVV